jgi:hypothetical protein
MNRDYKDGISDSAVFFVGSEVEKTPAFGLKTLFVVGIQSYIEIKQHFANEQCQHIFFGANHSFNPIANNYDSWKAWEDMITPLLNEGILCSLDIPLSAVEEFHDGGLCEHNNFIPQIRIPIPYIKLWNYNTMIKIDDKDFKATNPGVWCHSLHDLIDREKFTDWSKYGLDKLLG